MCVYHTSPPLVKDRTVMPPAQERLCQTWGSGETYELLSFEVCGILPYT